MNDVVIERGSHGALHRGWADRCLTRPSAPAIAPSQGAPAPRVASANNAVASRNVARLSAAVRLGRDADRHAGWYGPSVPGSGGRQAGLDGDYRHIAAASSMDASDRCEMQSDRWRNPVRISLSVPGRLRSLIRRTGRDSARDWPVGGPVRRRSGCGHLRCGDRGGMTGLALQGCRSHGRSGGAGRANNCGSLGFSVECYAI
jgi:hypothetical protein